MPYFVATAQLVTVAFPSNIQDLPSFFTLVVQGLASEQNSHTDVCTIEHRYGTGRRVHLHQPTAAKLLKVLLDVAVAGRSCATPTQYIYFCSTKMYCVGELFVCRYVCLCVANCERQPLREGVP